ncbi:MAG TPA: DNA repair protein RecN, partial [Steroidobacteraceae bacterium]|nr:DNA repair protein RecN [Steroidobacteraceae bacterium]
MLTHLQIRDLAIVDALELAFAGGLTVLTGETGAGKSIIVDALTLVAGSRADASQVRAGAARAEVSASFDILQIPPALREILAAAAIEVEGELLVRRVIGADGRSRAFINGQAVTLQQMQEITAFLLDVHGQHEFQSLVRPAAQRELLDTYGRLEDRAAEVAAAHGQWRDLNTSLQQIEVQLRDRDARLALLRFQQSELAALDLAPGEAEDLLSEAARLANGGRLLEGSQLAAQLLYEGDDTAQARLARAQAALRPLAELDPGLAPILPLLDEAAIRITEAARELARYAGSLDLDSARQAQVERRLAAAEELARKHRITTSELPAQRETLRKELEALEAAAEDCAGLQRQRDEALAAWRQLAGELSGARQSAAVTFGKEISARMQQLGMAGGRFEVAVRAQPDAAPTAHGIDAVEFQVTANPGQPLRPLAKVASGGELARLSLAVQVACVADERRCMVFDEVDAGIGGSIAEVVGRQLRSLGVRGQVLCVTHLPQVAAQGHQQLKVSKTTSDGHTHTSLFRLTGKERIQEIAR